MLAGHSQKKCNPFIALIFVVEIKQKLSTRTTRPLPLSQVHGQCFSVKEIKLWWFVRRCFIHSNSRHIINIFSLFSHYFLFIMVFQVSGQESYGLSLFHIFSSWGIVTKGVQECQSLDSLPCTLFIIGTYFFLNNLGFWMEMENCHQCHHRSKEGIPGWLHGQVKYVA